MNNFWETTPVIRSIYWRTLGRWKSRREQRRWAALPPEKVFGEIYETNRWSDPESRSGTGSNLEQTAVVREALPVLFERYQVRTFLDIPCGDYYWMSNVKLGGVRYIGGDIVPSLIERNQARYGSESVTFRTVNLIENDLPPADLLLVRDCLVHLSFRDAKRAIANIKRSPVRYLLTTTFIDVPQNDDIITGQWRMLDLTKSPFNFPPAVELIDEQATESRHSSGKRLGLWEVKTLPDFLEHEDVIFQGV